MLPGCLSPARRVRQRWIRVPGSCQAANPGRWEQGTRVLPPGNSLSEQTPVWHLSGGRALRQTFPSQPAPSLSSLCLQPQQARSVAAAPVKKETSAGPSGFEVWWGQIKPARTMGPLARAQGRALRVLLISCRSPGPGAREVLLAFNRPRRPRPPSLLAPRCLFPPPWGYFGLGQRGSPLESSIPPFRQHRAPLRLQANPSKPLSCPKKKPRLRLPHGEQTPELRSCPAAEGGRKINRGRDKSNGRGREKGLGLLLGRRPPRSPPAAPSRSPNFPFPVFGGAQACGAVTEPRCAGPGRQRRNSHRAAGGSGCRNTSGLR